MNLTRLFYILLLISMISCSKDEPKVVSQEWLIPIDEVQDGGPGKDGIPSIDQPQFIAVNDVNYLDDNDLVIGIIKNGEQKAYPHPIMDWHEIANDNFMGLNYALTYCPLTGTAMAWNNKINDKVTTFGVSGKLYNNNLLPYDRTTDSYWSQMNMNCVNGELVGTKIEVFPTLETSWATWKKMYPNSKILSTNTGYNRRYGVYPYGNYKTSNTYIIFPVNPSDNRLPAKERVLGVINNGNNIAYSINLFDSPRAITDKSGSDDLLVIGSKKDNFIVAFKRGIIEDLSIDLSHLPIVGTDKNGNVLSISGKIMSGPNAGTQLEQPLSFVGYWFSFGAFYPGIEIFE